MVKTLQEVKESGLHYYVYDGIYNDDLHVYDYEDEDGFVHLVIDGKDVLKNRRAIDCNYQGWGTYGYENKTRKVLTTGQTL